MLDKHLEGRIMGLHNLGPQPEFSEFPDLVIGVDYEEAERRVLASMVVTDDPIVEQFERECAGTISGRWPETRKQEE